MNRKTKTIRIAKGRGQGVLTFGMNERVFDGFVQIQALFAPRCRVSRKKATQNGAK
jgi:hypothetical protein